MQIVTVWSGSHDIVPVVGPENVTSTLLTVPPSIAAVTSRKTPTSSAGHEKGHAPPVETAVVATTWPPAPGIKLVEGAPPVLVLAALSPTLPPQPENNVVVRRASKT